MKRSIVGIILFGIFFVLGGCASTDLKMSPDDVFRIGPNEGLVIGSVVVNVEDLPEGGSVGSWKVLKDLKWRIAASTKEDMDSIVSVSSGYEIDAISDSKEIQFVSKLSAGRYYFHSMTQSGWVAGVAPKFPIRIVSFDVVEREISYIGRLILTLPHYIPNSKYMMGFFTKLSVEINDAQDETINILAMDYNLPEKKIKKNLMAQRAGLRSDGLFLPTITKDKLFKIKSIIKSNGYNNITKDNYLYEGAYITQYSKSLKSPETNSQDQVRIYLGFKTHDLFTGPYSNLYVLISPMKDEGNRNIKSEIKEIEGQLKAILY